MCVCVCVGVGVFECVCSIDSFLTSKGQIFYTYCISAMLGLSYKKMFQFVLNKFFLYLLQLSTFLELRHVLLRYDKHKKFDLKSDLSNARKCDQIDLAKIVKIKSTKANWHSSHQYNTLISFAFIVFH
jgi:hypothetical protein